LNSYHQNNSQLPSTHKTFSAGIKIYTHHFYKDTFQQQTKHFFNNLSAKEVQYVYEYDFMAVWNPIN